jgi:hypothetical protein
VPRSLYAGSHFDNLAAYLQRPYEAKAPDLILETTKGEKEVAFSFVTFYDLDPHASSEKRMTHLSSPKDFESKAKALDSSPYGRLIFMRGCPTPEWLLTIGAFYHVDPEFFRRHLDFRQGLRNHYSHPSLPSALGTAVKLQMTTIGASATKTKADSEQSSMEALQKENQNQLKEYRETLRNLFKMNLGDPIIRDCAIHDLQHFTIEQDVSVYVNNCGQGWFGKHLGSPTI